MSDSEESVRETESVQDAVFQQIIHEDSPSEQSTMPEDEEQELLKQTRHTQRCMDYVSVDFNRAFLDYYKSKSTVQVDSDLCFFKSVLPDVKTMNSNQKQCLKIGVLQLIGDILTQNQPSPFLSPSSVYSSNTPSPAHIQSGTHPPDPVQSANEDSEQTRSATVAGPISQYYQNWHTFNN